MNLAGPSCEPPRRHSLPALIRVTASRGGPIEGAFTGRREPNEDGHLVASRVGLERDVLPVVRDPDVPRRDRWRPRCCGPARRSRSRSASGEIAAPVCAQFGDPDAAELRKPLLPAKLATQTLSLPSTAMPHGNGQCLHRRTVAVCRHGVISVIVPPGGAAGGYACRLGTGRRATPEFATHKLPWLSAAMPRGLRRPPPLMGDHRWR